MIHRYIIEATDEVKGFEKAIEKLDREWGIEELEPCDDTISRQAVDDAIYDYSRACDVDYAQIMEYIEKLPSVTPARNKICYNINTGYDESEEFFCTNCGIQRRGWYGIEHHPDAEDIDYNNYKFNYCPNCGARIKRIE